MKIVLSLNKVSSLYYIPTLTRSLKHQPAQKAACATSCKREPSVSRPADHRRIFFAPPAPMWSPVFALAPAAGLRVLTGGQGRGARGPPTLLCAAINTESVGGEGRRGRGAGGAGRRLFTRQSDCQSPLIGWPRPGTAAPGWGAGVGVQGWWWMFAGWGVRFLRNSPYLASLFRQNGVPDLINTSIRRDCINTRLITAVAA